MKKLLAVPFLLTVIVGAQSQSDPSRHPAGEPPLHVRNGAAVLVGHFPDPQQMLRLSFGLQPPHLVEEEAFLQQLQDPASPQFHRFLTAAEWNARFAPSPQDEDAVIAWARSIGLRITQRYANRLLVDVEAPLDTIEKGLSVRINNYAFEGYTYFSNEREPALPANLVTIVHSVGGLNNFPEMRPAGSHGPQPPGPIYRPGPVIGVGHSRKGDGDSSKRPSAHAIPNESPVPNITNNLYDPTDIYNSNAYNYAALQNQGHCCNPLHNGGGSPPESSIGLATFGNLHWNGSDFTDVLGFHNQYPYLAYNVTTIPINGGPGTCTVTATQSCANDSETTLDTEWSTATANSFGSYLDTAHVYVYQSSGSAEDMYNAMLSDGHARVFSTSWSCTENAGCASSSTMDTRHNIFNQMIGQGWTLMTASGDRGATDDCSTTSVSYPASDPDVIGVGGTLLSLFNDGTFQSEVAWTGGTSANSCSSNNGGSGGGCSVHFSAPGFQSGSSQACGSSSRSVPDISLDATGGENYYWNGVLRFAGGTSISSPMLAGFFAQSEAYLLYLGSITGNDCGSLHLPCTPIGNANPFIYYFGLNPTYAPHYPFYDITSGCNTNDITAGNSTLTSYCSGTGYDSVTGWGTANMLQFAWAMNTFFAGDFSAPSVAFSGPIISHYYNTSQTVSWTVTDVSGNGAKPTGVAGFTQAWDTNPDDSSSKATPGSGDGFYSGPQFPNATSGFLVLNNSHEGCHTVHVRTWDNGGSTADHTYGPVCFDDIPPFGSCGSSDGVWHPADVAIACTAGDTLSGLANPADASFNLTTSVPAGTETANAFTNTHTVFDNAGNSTTEGPVGGNMVDKKAPSITIATPAATQYILNQAVASSYSCADGGSGLATCVGPVASGSPIDTATVGTKTFTVNATDKVANAGAQSVSYDVTYKICLQYDPTKPTNGRAENITLQLCDVNDVNVSNMSITVTAVAVDGNPALAKSLGGLNPGNLFLYGPGTSPGASYLYVLDTQGLGVGAHVLTFQVQGDPIVHAAPFILKK
jgi:Pro-kumamolisin, activation domain